MIPVPHNADFDTDGRYLPSSISLPELLKIYSFLSPYTDDFYYQSDIYEKISDKIISLQNNNDITKLIIIAKSVDLNVTSEDPKVLSDQILKLVDRCKNGIDHTRYHKERIRKLYEFIYISGLS